MLTWIGFSIFIKRMELIGILKIITQILFKKKINFLIQLIVLGKTNLQMKLCQSKYKKY